MEHGPGPAPHEVVRALAARRRADSQPGARADRLRISLVIEGGGMRGIISGEMALGLDELGLVPAFDAVYGASAGSITGAWLLSRPEGLRGWAEPAYSRTLIRRTALLRGRPVADIRALIEDLYQTTYPMDFAAVLASPVEFTRWPPTRPPASPPTCARSSATRPSCAWPCGPAPRCPCWPARRSSSPAAASTTPASRSPSLTAPPWPRARPTC
ncbi:MAG TPA: patatin-like phospholipase family protein [Streptosporangiaceae bacterium]|nr:patatin-like phospholipase family protein [Streptosporangiaceae bacterium]HLN67261.1 patatin-like phospholipase family protein [Streptosporangiaceae bacterium]